jgi:hypothetical protein
MLRAEPDLESCGKPREKYMRNKWLYTVDAVLRILFVTVGLISNRPLRAQIPDLQARVQEMIRAAAKNKRALAQFTWVEQVTINLKGKQKKQENFQVRLGPDGRPQNISLDPAPPQSEGPRKALKAHLFAKKNEEYKEYAYQLKSLAQQYLPPEKDRLQQARDRKDITSGTVADAPNELLLIIHNYLKPQDSMTLIIDKTQKQLLSIQVASYIDGAKDAANLTVQFIRLPDGSNQISNTVIDGIGKQLNIAIQDSNYQHI